MNATNHIRGCLAALLVFVTCSAFSASAQTLTNNGAQIHIRENALMVVNGSTLNKAGEIRVYDNAIVRFRGDVTLRLGGLYMERNSLAVVSNNLTIEVNAVLWRYAPGTLDVEGTIVNYGDLNNEGEINIGRP